MRTKVFITHPQSIPQVVRYLNENQNISTTFSGARVRGWLNFVGFILWGQWICVENQPVKWMLRHFNKNKMIDWKKRENFCRYLSHSRFIFRGKWMPGTESPENPLDSCLYLSVWTNMVDWHCHLHYHATCMASNATHTYTCFQLLKCQD